MMSLVLRIETYINFNSSKCKSSQESLYYRLMAAWYHRVLSGIQKAKSADWMIKTVGKFKNKLANILLIKFKKIKQDWVEISSECCRYKNSTNDYKFTKNKKNIYCK